MTKSIIIKGTLILTISSILSRILGFLYRIFLSNLIGAKGMGIFQLIFPVLGFCIALSSGGIQIAVSRFVAESKNKRDQFLVLISSLLMSFGISVVTFICLYYFASPISVFIIQNRECQELLKYASITIPLTAFHACVSGYYLGMKKTFIPATSSIFEQVVKVCSVYILGLVYVGNNIPITPLIAVYSMIISELGGVLFCIISLCTEKKYSLNIKALFTTMKKTFSVSYILTINKIMLTFLQCVEAILIPIVLIRSGLSSSASLSVYGILTGMALPVISFPSAINMSVSTMILPTIAKANTTSNKNGVKHTTEMTIWFSLVSGIFCIGFFLLYGDFIGSEIFGHKEAGEFIRILAWLCPFMYLSITMGSVLHGLGKTTATFVHNVIGTVLRLGFLWFAVPSVGINGYLWGLLASNLMITVLHGYYVYKNIHFHFSAVNSIIKPIIWLLCGMIMGNLLKYILSFSGFYGKTFNFISQGICAITICGIFGFFFLREVKEMYH